LAVQISFKKTLRKALQVTAAVAKSKFVQTKGFKFIKLFRKQKKLN